MVDGARRAGVLLALMFQRRLEPIHHQAQAIIASGELGRLFDVEMVSTGWYRLQSYYDSGAWRATWRGEGGGILANQAPHDLDLLHWLGGMPQRITATLATRIHHIEVEDTVNATLDYGGGQTGRYKATTSDPTGSRGIEISGDRGRIAIRDGQLLRCRYSIPLSKDILESRDRRTSAFRADWEEVALEPGGNTTAGIIANFARAIRTGEALVASGSDGVAALELANAMHLAGFMERPVSLPVDRQAVAHLFAELRAGRRP